MSTINTEAENRALRLVHARRGDSIPGSEDSAWGPELERVTIEIEQSVEPAVEWLGLAVALTRIASRAVGYAAGVSELDEGAIMRMLSDFGVDQGRDLPPYGDPNLN